MNSGTGGLTMIAAGDVTLNGGVSLTGGDLTIGVIGGTPIGGGSFANAASGTISTGGGDVSIYATDEVTLGGVISNAGAISIQSDDAGAAPITISQGIDTAGQNIRFYDNVIVGGSVAISSGASGGNLQFDGSINDDASSTDRTLTLTAGTGTISFGDIGNTQPLSGVNVTSSNGITFNGTIYNTNTQTYSGGGNDFDIATASPGVSTFSGSGDITFSNGRIDLANDTHLSVSSTGGSITTGDIQGDSAENVTLNANGTLSVGVIGDGTGINDVTLTGGTVNLAGNILTASGGNVVVSGSSFAKTNLTVNAAGAGDITFNNTLDADGTARSLLLDSGSGDILFTGAVGSGDPLSSITINNAADTTFSSSVATDGAFTQTTGTGTTTLTGAASAGSFDVTATIGIVASSTLTATGGRHQFGI